MEYTAYLRKTKASDFGVIFPDFPGCITAGKPLEEGRQFAAEAPGFHIKGMVSSSAPRSPNSAPFA
jgi:predicted RNase H-like HicB family nuclease